MNETSAAPMQQPLAQAPVAVAVAAAQGRGSPSLISRVAARFGVDPTKMMATLKATAFRQRGDAQEPTNEQMMALLVVADQYGLNPWTREIYAFPDRQNGIVPVVGVDGWSRIVNEHPQFDGIEFVDGPASEKHKGAPEWIECIMYRKDRSHPIRVRERLIECVRDTNPWTTHPSRMLRHKAFIQAARLAFGFVGIYDEDEAQRIVEGSATIVADAAPAIAAINAKVSPATQQSTPALEHAPGMTIPTTIPARSGEQVRAQQETAPQDAHAEAADDRRPAPPTFADVANAINGANDADALAVARDLIRSVASEEQRVDLAKLAEFRAAEIDKAAKPHKPPKK